MDDLHDRVESDDQWMALPDVSSPPQSHRSGPPGGAANTFGPPPIDLGPPTGGAVTPPASPSPSRGRRRKAALIGAGAAVLAASVGVVAALASGGGDDDDNSATTSAVTARPGTADGAVIDGGTFSVGQSLDIDLGSGGTTATLVVAAAGPFDLKAEPLDDQDVELTYLSSSGSPDPTCSGVDDGSAGSAERCHVVPAVAGRGTVRVTPYSGTPGSGRVRLTASPDQSGAPSTTASPPTTVPQTTVPPTTRPPTTTAPPQDTRPLNGGTIDVGQYLDVELGPRGVAVAVDVAADDGGFEVRADPIDGQDVALWYGAGDGTFVDGCDPVNDAGDGGRETCDLQANSAVREWVVVMPVGASDAHGRVRVKAVTWPPDPSTVLEDLGASGWSESTADARSTGTMITCGGDYDSFPYVGFTRVWSTAAGASAQGSVLSFASAEGAADYIATLRSTFSRGCVAETADGMSYVFKDINVGSDGDVLLTYDLYDNGQYQFSAFEHALNAGPVVVDTECEGSTADCAALFDAAARRLHQVAG
jgi:hypothetical protein